MKGTRPLTEKEIRQVSDAFCGVYEVRNRSLFWLGISTGGRISELLALSVGDVWQNDKPVGDLLFDKNIVKGGEVSRAVPLNADGRAAVEKVIAWHADAYGNVEKSRALFPSRKGGTSLNRQPAHEILKKAFEIAGLNGKLATHSMRKSYAQRLYVQTRDIYIVKEMLGHQSVETTQAYLGVDYQQIKQASEAICLFSNNGKGDNEMLQGVSKEALLFELARRGYKVAIETEKETP